MPSSRRPPQLAPTSVRTGFGLPRPILGAPLVLARTAWVLIPVGVLGVVVELVTVFMTKDVPPIWSRLDRVTELLKEQKPGPAIHVIDPNIYAWIIRVSMDELLQLVGASLVVVAAVHWVVGGRSRPSAVLALTLRKARQLVAIWFISHGLVAGLIVAGLLMILGSARYISLLTAGLWMVMLGGACGAVSALLLFAALPIVVVEHTGVFRALGRSSVLAMRRLPAVFGTIVLAKVAAWFIGLVLGGGANVVAAGAGDSWPVLGTQHGVAAALAVALDGVLYLLRYLDTRARKEGYDRAALVAELDVAQPKKTSASA